MSYINDHIHVALMNAQAAANDGAWLEVCSVKDANIHFEDFNDGTAQIRGSSAMTQPADNTHGTQIGADITADAHVSITNLPKFIKVRKTVAGTDTPSAYILARP